MGNNHLLALIIAFIILLSVLSLLPIYLFRNKFYSKAEMVVWGIVFLLFPFVSVLIFLIIKLSFPKNECGK
jgi:uncharacterized membrane protein|tara:strand:+ start:3111 stop:3323 length:213 start_codon:yes stop_codon:yes gene_type:complete